MNESGWLFLNATEGAADLIPRMSVRVRPGLVVRRGRLAKTIPSTSPEQDEELRRCVPIDGRHMGLRES